MKKIILINVIFMFFTLNAFASGNSNAVVLNLDDEKEEIQNVQNGRVDMNNIVINHKPDNRAKEKEILLYKDVNRLQQNKHSVSKSIEKEVMKNTSVGATYSTTEKTGELHDAVSVYSKYEKEHFGITTSYTQDGDKLKHQGVQGGTVSFAPEVTVNKHLKIKNVYSENMTSNQQKNEVVLSVRPFKDDRVDFDLGAGQTYSTSNQPAKSQISIGTKIRF